MKKHVIGLIVSIDKAVAFILVPVFYSAALHDCFTYNCFKTVYTIEIILTNKCQYLSDVYYEKSFLIKLGSGLKTFATLKEKPQ